MRIALALALLALSAPEAYAQFMRQDIERLAQVCNNATGEIEAREVERACTTIIRSDQATSPARAFAYRQRGAMRLAQGNQAAALEDFSAAIEHNPHFAVAYMSRAAIYETQSEFERAIADYDEVVRLAPEMAGAYNARCWLRARAGRRLDLAEADCERALELSGGAAAAYDTRGMLRLRTERFEDAWQDYNAALVREQGNAHYLYGRGIAALRLGRTQEGQADLAAARAADSAVAASYESYGVTP